MGAVFARCNARWALTWQAVRHTDAMRFQLRACLLHASLGAACLARWHAR